MHSISIRVSRSRPTFPSTFQMSHGIVLDIFLQKNCDILMEIQRESFINRTQMIHTSSGDKGKNWSTFVRMIMGIFCCGWKLGDYCCVRILLRLFVSREIFPPKFDNFRWFSSFLAIYIWQKYLIYVHIIFHQVFYKFIFCMHSICFPLLFLNCCFYHPFMS